MTLALVRRLGAHRRQAAARHRAGLRRRRGGRRAGRARTTWSTTTRDLFADCTEAISEVGGFSVSLNDSARALPDPDRREGHRLAAAAGRRPARARLDGARRQRGHPARRRGVAHRRATSGRSVITDTVRATDRGARRRRPACDLDPDDAGATGCPSSAALARMIGATVRNTANPTMLEAGYKANVIPSSAEATIDARFLPGQEDECSRPIDELIGEGVEREFDRPRHRGRDRRSTARWSTRWSAALRAEDPDAHPVPYLMSGGTDAKSFSHAGHALLRLLAAAAAAGPGLHCRCSTASTSGCRSTGCSSASACSTGSCPPADAPA